MAQPVQIRGYSPECYFDFTRPANTTTYAVGDHVTSTATGSAVTPFKFPVTKDANGCGFITGARLMKTTTTTTAASFRLWLFIREPFAAAGYPADNAALSFAFGNAGFKSCIGYFDFDAANWITGTDSAFNQNSVEQSLPFSLDKVGAMPSSDSHALAGQTFDRTQLIYGLLEARGAYAPGSAEEFRVAIDVSPVPASSRSIQTGDVVQGTTADGSAVSGAGKPVLVAGQDGTNVQTLLTDTRGAPIINSGDTAVATELTRPSDTNAYASGDAIANSTTGSAVVPLEWTSGQANGFTGKIVGARALTDSATAIDAIRLHLFNAEPFAAAGYQADNAALALTYTALKTGAAGANPNYIGSIDFPTWVAHTSSARSIGQCGQSELTFDCASASQKIYGLLECRTAFTPASGQKFNVVIDVVQG